LGRDKKPYDAVLCSLFSHPLFQTAFRRVGWCIRPLLIQRAANVMCVCCRRFCRADVALPEAFNPLPGACYIGVFRCHVWKYHPAMMLIINVNRLLRYAGCCMTFF